MDESKCSLVRFGFQKSSSSHVYSINSCVIQNDSQHKDLGIIVSSDLSWTNHILYIATKAYNIFGLLRRSFRNCNSVHSKKLLYISLVRSQLIYGSQVWRPHLLKDMMPLRLFSVEALSLFSMTIHLITSLVCSHINYYH